jgi:hypothetical protein
MRQIFFKSPSGRRDLVVRGLGALAVTVLVVAPLSARHLWFPNRFSKLNSHSSWPFLLALTGGYCYNLFKPIQVSSTEPLLFFQMTMVISRLSPTKRSQISHYAAAGLQAAMVFFLPRRMNL